MLNRFNLNQKINITSDNLMPMLSDLFNLDDCQSGELFQIKFERLKQELMSEGAVIYKFSYKDISAPSNARVSLNIIPNTMSTKEECMLWRAAAFFRSNNYVVEFSSNDCYQINLYDKLDSMNSVSGQSIRFFPASIKNVISDIFSGRKYIWLFPKSLKEQSIFLICISNDFSNLLQEGDFDMTEKYLTQFATELGFSFTNNAILKLQLSEQQYAEVQLALIEFFYTKNEGCSFGVSLDEFITHFSNDERDFLCEKIVHKHGASVA